MMSSADFAVIDLQHGLWDRLSAHNAVGLIGGSRALIRSANGDDAAISQALDTGAAGVIVPMIETAAQAAAAVLAAGFMPAGRRSAGGVRPIVNGLGNYVRSGRPVIGIMIESRTGVENAEAIAAVDGVDFIFIGSGDLRLSLAATDDAAFDRACDAILVACRGAGKPCGIFTPAGRSWREMIERGFSIVTTADDIGAVMAGFADPATGEQ
ncbi:hypothetical protein ASD39_05975 [Sphingomonas sp. Root50]|nr:hypothetical protein ASD17_03455 [Sphingomonas sp. Root1294]KQY68225.1 hypothetical protein ASD39_05975 [Sphingomonas sp. Root50]KRB91122.1 hypothetical protein ASE22_12775 [Sphingomonas sp. Root720]